MSMMRLSGGPQTPADLLRAAVQIYARYLPVWVLLALLALGPVLVLNVVTAQVGSVDPALMDRLQAFNQELNQMPLNPANPGDLPFSDAEALSLFSDIIGALVGAAAVGCVISVVGLLAQYVVFGGFGAVLAAAGQRGQTISLGEAWRALLPRLAALLNGHIVAGLLLLVGFAASLMLTLLCVGVLGLGVLAYVFLAWVPLLAPVLVLEHGPLPRLLLRAWHFGKKRVWLVLRVLVGFWALRFVLSLPFGFLSSALMTPFDDTLAVLVDPGSPAFWVQQIGFLLVQGLTLPLEAILYTLIYFDARERLEPGVVVLADEEYPAPPEPMLTSADMPNMVAIGMLAVVGLFALAFLVPF